MRDLVEKLRRYAKNQAGWIDIDDTCESAADEIERLRARVAELETPHWVYVIDDPESISPDTYECFSYDMDANSHLNINAMAGCREVKRFWTVIICDADNDVYDTRDFDTLTEAHVFVAAEQAKEQGE